MGGGGNLVPSLTTVPHPLRYAPCKLEPHPCIVAITKYLRGSLPKSGPLDFATKNTFALFFVGEEALVGVY